MKHLKVFIKFTSFFIGWAVLAGLLDISLNNKALWRLSAEVIPLLCLILFSVVFWLIDKKRIVNINKPLKSIFIGILLGIIWLVVPTICLFITKSIFFNGINSVNNILIYSFACLFNVILQELLVRGYLYQLIKTNYNKVFAIIISTLLFVFLHGFDLNILNIINIFLTGILLSLAMEYFDSMIVPVLMHFIWNYFGCMILGLGKLADDYPIIMNITINKTSIEGSIFVTIINLLLITILLYNVVKRRKI